LCHSVSELLSWISFKHWNIELTRKLCDSALYLIKKSEDVVASPYPILFIALLSEFISELGENSKEHENRCSSLVELYLNLGFKIQSNFKEEKELKHHLF
jgi:hypothetical protein